MRGLFRQALMAALPILAFGPAPIDIIVDERPRASGRRAADRKASAQAPRRWARSRGPAARRRIRSNRLHRSRRVRLRHRRQRKAA